MTGRFFIDEELSEPALDLLRMVYLRFIDLESQFCCLFDKSYAKKTYHLNKISIVP
jgi:hypothetical protein